MITLATIVWEKNFEQVLHPDSWFMKYTHPLVTRKILVVNNVDNLSKLKSLIKDVEVVYVSELAEISKKRHNITIYPHTLGYYYTIPYFVLLHMCPTKYLFLVSPDCAVNFEEDYLTDSIEALKRDDVIATTLPQGDTNYYTKVFSDQVFITDIDKLRNVDYNTEYGGDFSPHYGGNSFEKRLSSWMHHNNKLRWIYKKYNYIHK